MEVPWLNWFGGFLVLNLNGWLPGIKGIFNPLLLAQNQQFAWLFKLSSIRKKTICNL
jgi:hypothetical protein